MTHSSSPPRRPRRPNPRQAGVVLMTTVLCLIVLTLLALAMYRGFGAQQKIAGNTREKERAFQSAQNALEFSEGALVKLTSGGALLGVACTASTTVVLLDDVRACSLPLDKPADPDSWVGASTYNPPAMKVQTDATAVGGTTTDGDSNLDIIYAKSPQLYVQFLGGDAAGSGIVLYSVTGGGAGGAASTRAVVKSVYSIAAPLALPDTNPSQSK